MKMKSQFQEKLEHEIEARKAAKDLCEKCGKTLEIDQVHTCSPQVKSLGELANEFEDRYNAKMGRTGVRWAGD
jgi:hypothetical protein